MRLADVVSFIGVNVITVLWSKSINRLCSRRENQVRKSVMTLCNWIVSYFCRNRLNVAGPMSAWCITFLCYEIDVWVRITKTQNTKHENGDKKYLRVNFAERWDDTSCCSVPPVFWVFLTLGRWIRERIYVPRVLCSPLCMWPGNIGPCEQIFFS